MKITSLVTGGAGFIGSHVVTNLIALGYEVIVLDDLSGGYERNIHKEAHLIIGSITDTALVNRLFEKYQFTYVYHLAAYAAEGLSHFIRRFNYENNVIGSINLINAAVNNEVSHFVFTSSIAVYGAGQLPLTESNDPRPEDPYGIAKYAIELDLKNANKMFGLDYTIFRPHNVYGPKQNIKDPYRNVIGIFMNKLLNNESLPVFGDGEQRRAFTYIDDVAPFIANCYSISEAKNQTFNIGTDEVTSVNDLAMKVCNAMGIENRINYLEKREEVFEAYADHSNFRKVFDPKPSMSLDKGLMKMADWAKSIDHVQETASIKIEVEKNLPESWKQNKK